MPRKLPTLQLGDERFFVDLEKWELTEVHRPRNKISLNNLVDKKGHSQLLYDTSTRNVFKGSAQAAKNAGERLVTVMFPEVAALKVKKNLDYLQKGVRNKIPYLHPKEIVVITPPKKKRGNKQ